MIPPINNSSQLDLSKTQDQLTYVHEAHNLRELHQKEMDVNLAEQNLLHQKIVESKNRANDLPSSHPEYSILLTQAQIDQLELDKKKMEAEIIAHTLNTPV